MRKSEIHSERLRITPFTERHLNKHYVSWLNDPDLMIFSEQRHKSHTLETCREYLRSFEAGPNYFWAVLNKESGAHIGTMTAYVDEPNKVADVGILIGDRDSRGKGFAVEACRVVVGFLLREAGLRKVTMGCLEVNKPMIGVMKSLNAKPDGTRRRQVLWRGQEVDVVHGAFFSDFSF